MLASYRSAYNGLKVLIAGRQLAKVGAIPGVVAVHPLQQARRAAVPQAVPLAISPTAWGGLAAFNGNGIKVAIIDTGIDYTHANFGGPGTPEAYEAAAATDTKPARPALVRAERAAHQGRHRPRREQLQHRRELGRTSSRSRTRTPTRSTATGMAPTWRGSRAVGCPRQRPTYTGPYTPSAIAAQSWTILPGVAPKVDLYAVRIFGCLGSTDAIIDGIDWAVARRMQVINLSVGSSFGSGTDPAAVAAENAAKAGHHRRGFGRQRRIQSVHHGLARIGQRRDQRCRDRRQQPVPGGRDRFHRRHID